MQTEAQKAETQEILSRLLEKYGNLSAASRAVNMSASNLCSYRSGTLAMGETIKNRMWAYLGVDRPAMLQAQRIETLSIQALARKYEAMQQTNADALEAYQRHVQKELHRLIAENQQLRLQLDRVAQYLAP
jgi:hypothetical protein